MTRDLLFELQSRIRNVGVDEVEGVVLSGDAAALVVVIGNACHSGQRHWSRDIGPTDALGDCEWFDLGEQCRAYI